MEVTIDFSNINTWEQFHDTFAVVIGFPDFYGNNMNAWIDCMTYIDDTEAGMSKVLIKKNASLEILVQGFEKALKANEEIVKAFLECTAFVNQRFIEDKSKTRIKIILT